MVNKFGFQTLNFQEMLYTIVGKTKRRVSFLVHKI